MHLGLALAAPFRMGVPFAGELRQMAEADAYSPPDTATMPLNAPEVPYAAALEENIRRLKLVGAVLAVPRQ